MFFALNGKRHICNYVYADCSLMDILLFIDNPKEKLISNPQQIKYLFKEVFCTSCSRDEEVYAYITRLIRCLY